MISSSCHISNIQCVLLLDDAVRTGTEVFGVIRCLAPFRLTGGNKDYLAVSSDSGRYASKFTLNFAFHACMRML